MYLNDLLIIKLLIMELKRKTKSLLAEIICLLYILLFIYAAVSKILDFENFKVQLGQSPMLSIYAGWISWTVIGFELLTVFLLALPKTKILGLYASLGLMTMFSAYIFILLNFSSFVPCSCGGILEKMSWNTHLIFNLIFVLFAVFALLLKGLLKGITVRSFIKFKAIKMIFGTILLSVFTVLVLFLSSEEVMYHDNPFIRRYPQHPAEFSNTFDLKYNSYYFAGYANHRIFLANYQYPSYLLSLNCELQDKKIEKLQLDPKKIPFKMITTSIRYPYFFVADGSVPIILRGDMKNWKITNELKGVPYFTRAVPIDGTSAVIRSNNSKNLSNVLGIFNSDSIPKVKYRRELLQKQIDGIFDTDGVLLYSEGLKKIIYLYFYRNEFVIADNNGVLFKKGHTIDTITKAKLKAEVINQGKQFVMSSPSYVVNADAAVIGNLLFVYSRVKGSYESEKLWKKSFIIDVYNLKKNTYVMSFPVYHTGSSVLNSFTVTNTNLYAIIGTDLVSYRFKEYLKKEIN